MAFKRKKKNEVENNATVKVNKAPVEEKPKGRAGRILKLLLILILVVVFVVTIVQNLDPAPISFFGLHGQLPTIAIILIFTLIGYVLGALTFNMIFGKSRKKKKQKKAPKDTDKE